MNKQGLSTIVGILLWISVVSILVTMLLLVLTM